MTRLSAHLAVCGGASVHLYTYPDRSPILTLTTGDVTVTIVMSKTDLDTSAMRFARELADAVTRFAEDCQRFTTTTDGPAGSASDYATADGSASTSDSAPRSAGRSRALRAA
ncbi:hypothetical protein I6A84_01780 [Frankia sp. CNm7]|uniref:Uncharacterized protein n=2 Tax=Frankia nepalensis TaxID=1836974 RepID=A0A937UNG7_9ACTN|nr:hypothetical protein [Frankia nepalensis]MBL7498158.1 hypothetical protein [Frankia nepalensis]MBL7509324.1 hypothetical protein [Frankia nepalensis]MBL7516888.1 hypothetical protein [Frankia nepalensis]MBL7627947.1 hypothetical protein [Frankia nepalensis]